MYDWLEVRPSLRKTLYLDIGLDHIWIFFFEGHCVFQAYATVTSAAEGKDPDSEEFGKVDDLKQYPLFTNDLHNC